MDWEHPVEVRESLLRVRGVRSKPPSPVTVKKYLKIWAQPHTPENVQKKVEMVLMWFHCWPEMINQLSTEVIRQEQAKQKEALARRRRAKARHRNWEVALQAQWACEP